MKRVYIFLILVASIAGMIGCGPTQYNLTISSTEGGKVTTPGEETFTYDEGTVVNLVAEADEGYQFVNWTGNVSAIADVNAVATNITMNGHYSITANFEELDPGTLFAGGDGTEGNPYQIANWHHLYNIRDYLNNHFILMNDLDSTTAGYTELASPTANGGKGWQPIGIDDNPFTGTFDGQGYEIRDLFINCTETYAGLFGGADEGGHIENIGVVDANVTGILVGGLVAWNLGTVSNSYATGSVTVTLSAEWIYVGGLVGANGGTVSNSHFTGNVEGTWSAGGLVGINSNEGTVNSSYSTGSVTGEGYGYVGGLVGMNWVGTVSDSYSTASVSGNTSAGGLVGYNAEGTVSNSYATGSVTGYIGVGGLVGANVDTLSNCYATGSATGNSLVGGLVGQNLGTISNCYSTGTVSGEDSVGGLVGDDYGTVSSSFWDTETSGQATSDGGTGKTTAEMQDIATFSGAGWDITAVAMNQTNPAYIWNIVNNVTYPFLGWEP